MVEEIKLYYSYPRLDINVTKSLNHLLKAPFCVHPKTGKISVPFKAKFVDNFDPSTVPTIW
jgi:DNA primase small subunit